jgi:membrane protein YdbS with pleckstrin-like domain
MHTLVEILPGENIIVGIRKHWFVFVLEMWGLFLAAIIPFFLLPFFGGIFADQIATIGQTNYENIMVFASGAWLLLIMMIVFIAMTNYYLDILIVTNQRLIDIDQIGLFARDVATMPIQNLEDVKVLELGFFATMFKFGSLQIQTAAETKEIVIRGLRHPERAKDIIMRAYQAAIGRVNPKL